MSVNTFNNEDEWQEALQIDPDIDLITGGGSSTESRREALLGAMGHPRPEFRRDDA